MKKVIATMLVGVLLASGLGSVAYALEEPVNRVHIAFGTHYRYNVPEDTFSNQQVTGEKGWHTALHNWHDETGEPVNEVTLTLEPAEGQAFDYMNPDPDSTDPPTWLFGSVDQGSNVYANVGSVLAPFTPGFDASRLIVDNKTVFLKSEGTQTQTVDITVTPRVEEEPSMFDIHVDAGDYSLVNALISSVSISEGYDTQVSWDERHAHIVVTDPGFGDTFTATVEIQVTPNVPKVEFIPYVEIGRSPFTPLYTTTDNLISLVSEIGTWTWSAQGNYEWLVHAEEMIGCSLTWHPRCRDLTNYVWAHFVTDLNYGPWPDTFTNGDEISLFWKDWDAKMGNSPDASGANVTGLTLSLDSELPFNTVSNGNLVTEEPPTYEWFFGDIPEGSGEVKAHVGLVGKEYSPPINFTPGFDASRSVDKAEFLQSEGTQQTQVLTVTVTPRQRTELYISLGADENDLISLLIISAISGDGVEYPTDGHRVNICPITGLEPNTTWTLTVTFLVTPKKPKVKFIPYVEVGWNETIASGTTSGSSVSYPAGDDPADEPGTWTWSAEGSYEWNWEQVLRPAVHWFTRCREMPVAQASVDPYLAPVGSDFTFDGSASSGAIVSYDWDFGDGNTGSGVTLDHAYEYAGLYKVTLTVTDDMGAESTDSVMAVVYDPTAGFATGGGWFIPGGETSYDNDYLPNIDGTSPANFGFVVKYKKGATTPDGQLEFQYQQGDFNLHSSGMEWLVITNKNWAKFQGLATIKGLDGLYPFHVDARDGDFGGRDQPDRFIIKVYAPGADPDQSDPIYKASGDLQGGNIVIHGEGYEVTTLRLQSWLAPDDPLMTPLENFAQAVEQGTEGSVRIELYSTAAPVMPNLWELADAIKWGDVEMGLIYSQLLRDYSRVMDAGWLPFLYNDDDGLTAAVQAGIGDLLSDELTGHNITALTWTTTGFSHLYSRQVMLDHPDALTQDVKIRVIGGIGGAHEGMQWEAITEWGGTPITAPFAEIYELLQKEFIHGAMHSPYAYEVMKFYEVAPYFCVDYAFANLTALAINSDVWNSLDADTQQIITDAAGNYVHEMLATVKQLDADALQRIEGYEGVTVYTLTPEERLVWREASKQVWDSWLAEAGDVGQQIIDIALTQNPLP